MKGRLYLLLFIFVLAATFSFGVTLGNQGNILAFATSEECEICLQDPCVCTCKDCENLLAVCTCCPYQLGGHTPGSFVTCMAGSWCSECLELIAPADPAKHNFGVDPICGVSTCLNGCGEKFKCLECCECNDHIEGMPATCTSPQICRECGEQMGSALGHDMQHVNGKPATCIEGGYEEYEQCSRCTLNTKIEIEIDPTAHGAMIDVGVAQAETCIATGIINTRCGDCGYTGTRETPIDPAAHDMQSVDGKLATCLEAGYEEYEQCTRCDHNTKEVIQALGHQFVNYTADDNATCISKGTETATCERCEEEDTKAGDAFGDHDMQTVPGKQATCTESGYTEHLACTLCHITVGEEETQAIGHDWEDGICKVCGAAGCETHDMEDVDGLQSTCKSPGYTAYQVCTICGEIVGKEETPINPDAHAMIDATEAQAATCVAEGIMNTECKYGCGYTDTRIIPVDPATHDMGHTNGKPATCTEPGYTAHKTCALCGETEEKEIFEIDPDAHGAMIDTTEAQAATCTEAGIMNTKCENNCGLTDTRIIETDPNAHGEMIDVNVAQAATCVAAGTMNTKCEYNCGHTGTREIPISQNAHDMQTVEEQPATCTEAGYTAYQECTICGEAAGKEEIPALDHDMQSVDVQPATCIEDGYSAHQACTRCDKTEGKIVIPAIGHEWENGVCKTCGATGCGEHVLQTIEGKPAACTQAGYTAYQVCSVCGEIVGKADLQALGHDYSTETIPATCTEDGSTTVTCSRCDYEDITVLPKLGHDWGLENIILATCIDNAVDHYKCANCSATKDEEIIGSALGHDFQIYTPDGNATCVDKGTQTATCENCDETDTVAGDTFGDHDEIMNTIFATCTEDGATIITCSRCDYEDVTLITKLGHDEIENTIHATCTEDGLTTITCSRCDYEDITVLPKLGHGWELESTTTATCIDNTIEHYKCNICAAAKDEEINGSAYGHEFSISLGATAPSVDSDGYEDFECSRCMEPRRIYDVGTRLIGGVTAAGITKTYDGNAYGISVAGTIAGDIVSYSLTQNGIYSTTPITNTNAGVTTVWVKVTRANYATLTLSATITIEINPTPPTFTTPTVVGEGAYGDKLQKWALSDGWVWELVDHKPGVGSETQTFNVYLDVSHLVDNYDFSGVEGYDSANHRIVRTVTIELPADDKDFTKLIKIIMLSSSAALGVLGIVFIAVSSIMSRKIRKIPTLKSNS